MREITLVNKGPTKHVVVYEYPNGDILCHTKDPLIAALKFVHFVTKSEIVVPPAPKAIPGAWYGMRNASKAKSYPGPYLIGLADGRLAYFVSTGPLAETGPSSGIRPFCPTTYVQLDSTTGQPIEGA